MPLRISVVGFPLEARDESNDAITQMGFLVSVM